MVDSFNPRCMGTCIINGEKKVVGDELLTASQFAAELEEMGAIEIRIADLPENAMEKRKRELQVN